MLLAAKAKVCVSEHAMPQYMAQGYVQSISFVWVCCCFYNCCFVLWFSGGAVVLARVCYFNFLNVSFVWVFLIQGAKHVKDHFIYSSQLSKRTVLTWRDIYYGFVFSCFD